MSTNYNYYKSYAPNSNYNSPYKTKNVMNSINSQKNGKNYRKRVVV